jgi:hypothetical protein
MLEVARDSTWYRPYSWAGFAINLLGPRYLYARVLLEEI